MPVVFAGICPHPPIMVPSVGGEKSELVLKSRQAMLELGHRLKESQAEVLIMISPHGPCFSDGIGVNLKPVLSGDLADFNAPQEKFVFENNLDLAEAIINKGTAIGTAMVGLTETIARGYGVGLKLDHGLTVPLHFISQSGVSLPLVIIYMGFLSYEELYFFGMAVRDAVEATGKRAAVIASGDLSHRLTQGAPAGYNPRGEEFDRELIGLLKTEDVSGILDFDRELVDAAGECGLRPIVMLLGILDGSEIDFDILSYEGPFGVGYLVAAIKPGDFVDKYYFGAEIKEKRVKKHIIKKEKEGFLPGVARKALENYTTGNPMSSEDVPEEFRKPAGVFVSLKKNGHLRGCIGTVVPQRKNIVEETINNAISAGYNDPRFNPLKESELDELDISVDVLGSPEAVESKDNLDPVRYGVIVKTDRKQGLLLPNLEGVDSVDEQLQIAKDKAGIVQGEPFQMLRFEVVRYY
ncbi:MAG: AmmeMemoRadiSam system protein A [Peptococcaceae bacterium]|nr:AmmeMemoRadiSam system protein A [Peptococcaceae bacterium]